MSDTLKNYAVSMFFFSCLAVFPLRAESFAERVDIGVAEMVSTGKMSMAVVDAALTITITPDRAETEIRLPLTRPLASRGKDRLLLTMRSRESSHVSLCLSRIHLEGENGQRATYEPDFGISPEWNMRTALFSEFEGPIPESVTAVILHFWVPNEVGSDFAVYIKDIELLDATDIAARVVPPAGPAPAKLTPVRSELKPADRQWVSIDPGGGGWYRTMAISPHDGTCFMGSDVGGIYVSRDNCKSWELHGGDLPNRFVQGFGFDPRDPDLVIAATKGGPVRSTDNGRTWKSVRQGLPQCLTFGQSAPMLSVVFHPGRPDLVLAGGGFDVSGYFGEIRPKDKWGAIWNRGRIYRSLDRGESWEICELPGEESDTFSVTSFVFSPSDPNVIYAAANGGLFSSVDAGKTWQKYGPDLNKYTLGFLAANSAKPDTWLLSYSGGADKRGGVLRSRDKGQTWEEVNQGLPARISAWRLIADAADPRTFYVGWFRNADLYVTHDQGDTWQEYAPSVRRAPQPYLHGGGSATGLAQDPRNPGRFVFCNAMHVYQTLDAGQNWELVTTDPVVPATADHPTAWRGRHCSVLCTGSRQVLAVDPAAPRNIYCGYWDVTAWKSEDGGRTFCHSTNGMDTGYGCMSAVVLDPADSRIVYLVKGDNRHTQRLYKSVDSGAGYYLIGHAASGLPPGVISNLAIDPTSPLDKRVIYAAISGKDMKRPGKDAGTFPAGVYRSDDGGFTWQPKSAGLPEERDRFAQLTMDPRNPKRLFLACDTIHPTGYIARSEDGGESWTVLKDKIEPQCVLIDPFDSQKIYVGNRNFSGNDYPNAFYRSLDGGETWETLTQDAFPCERFAEFALDKGRRINVKCLAADPLTPGRLYLACTNHGYDVSNVGGVYISEDWGQTWRPFDTTGLVNHCIDTFIVDPTDPARLYVGTGGNGFFRYGPPPR